MVEMTAYEDFIMLIVNDWIHCSASANTVTLFPELLDDYIKALRIKSHGRGIVKPSCLMKTQGMARTVYCNEQTAVDINKT